MVYAVNHHSKSGGILAFKEVFHFQPADEPLLQFVFTNKKYIEELKAFNKKLLLPKPELLLATKLNAITFRDKEHKKVKDLCDIFALLWYTSKNIKNLQKEVSQFLKVRNISKAINSIDEEDYQQASIQLNHSKEEIIRVIELLRS